MNYQFHFYPTLLNEFQRYFKEPDQESKKRLLNRINRIPETDPEVLQKFKKGIRFEEAVLKDKSSEISFELIEEARSLLPISRKTQQLVSFIHQNIRFYGFADVLGEERVIDLKSTAKHRPGRHDLNFQNLYLYALQDYGFKSMEYIICDFEQIFVESYQLREYDFDPLLQQMEEFRAFVLAHRNLITDKKIIQEIQPDLFG
ncbi:hypothetical protein [Jiulongibacter sediminis]|uniref:PD-(D/E)XK endonuclease-like domain-containing protein n=1 Tax=Jiulongibacter sediminis TaxID=1605367 RepID=A0A0N8H9I7_9BACT|nr:hypothetical protein [Jiulongibacter sediminis]KPM47484.1 hypothetical protein AFM12_13305 [Jiulongibacter sediminis]TBX23277.1 hypothetical protein TK44_13315 [Jiulongibacter sediminis]